MSKKIKFYSLHRAPTKLGIELKEHTGYTDGTFNFYGNSAPGKWFAIDPLTGMAVAEGDSAREVRDAVKTEKFIRKFDRTINTKRYQALVAQFEALCLGRRKVK